MDNGRKETITEGCIESFSCMFLFLMGILIIFFFLCLLLVKPAHADPLIGRDYLAFHQQNFNRAKAAAVEIEGAPIGVLDTTFGAPSDLQDLETYMNAKHPKYVRVHFINGPGLRNNQSGPYEIAYGYTKLSFDSAVARRDPRIINPFRARVSLYQGLAARHPETTFIYSPVLEHDLSAPSYRVLADVVLSVVPTAQLDNCPDGGVGAERYRGAWIERHGSAFQTDADIVSLDGAEGTDVDISAAVARAKNHVKVFFTWGRSFNCRDQNPKFTDPRARKACPKDYQFEEYIHVTDNVPPAPKFSGNQCSRVIPFPSNEIWKPLAEDSGNGDGRSNMPVALLQHAYGPLLKLMAANGVTVGTLGKYTDTKPTFRYYSGYSGGTHHNGYQFEKDAFLATNSRWIWIQTGSNCEGPILPGRRNGSYK